MIVMIKANDTIEMYSNVFTPNCINHPKLSPFFQGINDPQHGFMAARRSNAKVAPSTGGMSCGHTTGVCLWHSWCLSYLWFQLVIHGWFQFPSYMYMYIHIYIYMYVYIYIYICNMYDLQWVAVEPRICFMFLPWKWPAESTDHFVVFQAWRHRMSEP